MRLPSILLKAGVIVSFASSAFAASWTFTDATVSVQGKGSGVGGSLKEKIVPRRALSQSLKLGSAETLKVILTAQEDKAAKRPDQVFLLLKDSASNLDISYPFSVKDNGKANVQLTQKDLPPQFLRSKDSISASLVLASFGPTSGYASEAFKIEIVTDAGSAASGSGSGKPLRYGKMPEIHHVFRSEPKSPNAAVSLVFSTAAIATLPVLLGSWLYLGGNINHLSKALSDAPVSHALFVGSIFGLECILFLYYSSWNLFQTLPALFAVGMASFLSGSRALTEVQDRRLAGLR